MLYTFNIIQDTQSKNSIESVFNCRLVFAEKSCDGKNITLVGIETSIWI